MDIKRAIPWLVGGLFVLVAGVVIAAWQINDRVLPNTYIGQTDIGLISQDKAVAKINEELLSYSGQPVIVRVSSESGPVTRNFTLEELGITFNNALTASNLLEARLFSWKNDNPFKVLAASYSDYTTGVVTSPNTAKLQQAVDRLIEEINQPARDAQLVIMEAGPEIVPEEPGYGISGERLASYLLNHVAKLSSETIALTTESLQPKTTSQDLQPLVSQTNQILSQPFVIEVAGREFLFDRSNVSAWLVYDLNFARLEINQANIEKAVSEVAAQVNQPGSDTKLVKNTELVLEEGSQGLMLDQQAAVGVIQGAVLGPTPQHKVALELATSEPTVQEVFTPAAPSSSQGKIIKIVLSEQKLYAWEEGELVNSFLISSGLVGPTPVGNWSIYNKTALQPYRGADYFLPNVHWSSWFAPQIAIHEAYWHNNFGNPMSHGCVNATLGDSKFIYDWAPIGTPVEVVF